MVRRLRDADRHAFRRSRQALRDLQRAVDLHSVQPLARQARPQQRRRSPPRDPPRQSGARRGGGCAARESARRLDRLHSQSSAVLAVQRERSRRGGGRAPGRLLERAPSPIRNAAANIRPRCGAAIEPHLQPGDLARICRPLDWFGLNHYSPVYVKARARRDAGLRLRREAGRRCR